MLSPKIKRDQTKNKNKNKTQFRNWQNEMSGISFAALLPIKWDATRDNLPPHIYEHIPVAPRQLPPNYEFVA